MRFGFVQRWSHHPHEQFLELLSCILLDDEEYEFAIELERKVQINCIFWGLSVVDVVFYDFIFDLLLFFVDFAAF